MKADRPEELGDDETDEVFDHAVGLIDLVSPRDRLLFIREITGGSLRGAARHLGMSEDTLHTRKARLLKALKRRGARLDDLARAVELLRAWRARRNRATDALRRWPFPEAGLHEYLDGYGPARRTYNIIAAGSDAYTFNETEWRQTRKLNVCLNDGAAINELYRVGFAALRFTREDQDAVDVAPLDAMFYSPREGWILAEVTIHLSGRESVFVGLFSVRDGVPRLDIDVHPGHAPTQSRYESRFSPRLSMDTLAGLGANPGATGDLIAPVESLRRILILTPGARSGGFWYGFTRTVRPKTVMRELQARFAEARSQLTAAGVDTRSSDADGLVARVADRALFDACNTVAPRMLRDDLRARVVRER